MMEWTCREFIQIFNAVLQFTVKLFVVEVSMNKSIRVLFYLQTDASATNCPTRFKKTELELNQVAERTMHWFS